MKIRHAAPLAAFAALTLSGCGTGEEVNAKSANYPALPPVSAETVRQSPDLVNLGGVQVRPAAITNPAVSQYEGGVKCSGLAETIDIVGGNPVSTGEYGTNTYPGNAGVDIKFGTPRRGEVLIVNGKLTGLIPTADIADYIILLPEDWDGELKSVTICRLR